MTIKYAAVWRMSRMDDAAARAGNLTCTTPLATCITQTTQSSSVSKSSSTRSAQAAATAAYRREVHQFTLQFLQRQQSTTATATTTAALESTEDVVNDRTNKKQQKQEYIPLSILAAQLRDSLEDSTTPKSYCRGCGIGNTTDPTTVYEYPGQHLTLRLERSSCTKRLTRTQQRRRQRKQQQTNNHRAHTTKNERVLSCRGCGCVVARYPGTTTVRRQPPQRTGGTNAAEQQRETMGAFLSLPTKSRASAAARNNKKQKQTLSQGRKRRRHKPSSLSSFLTALEDR